jgi:putative acetyltransferase
MLSRTMEVRAARLEDCDALAHGMSAVVAEGRWLATEADTPPAELEQRFRASVEWDGFFLFVLEDGGEIVGSLGMQPTQADGVLSLGMWILPEWRGRGGGRLLVDVALAARSADVHKIELEVFPDNAAAIALYRSTGFEEEGLRRDHYRRLDGSLRSALIMARLFSGQS